MDHSRRCMNCSIRLAHQRWRTLQDATEPMVNILRTWISPTPVSPENRVCFECFGMLQGISDGGVAVPQPMLGHRSVCFACGVSILRTRTHLVRLDSQERNIIIRWILPHLASHLTRVCSACWMAARRNIQGVTLDEARSYAPHASFIGEKSSNCFGKMSRISATRWGVKYPALRVLYSGTYVATLTYAAAVWYFRSSNFVVKRTLLRTQRPALLLLTKAYRSCSTAALPVLAGFYQPIWRFVVQDDLRRRDSDWPHTVY